MDRYSTLENCNSTSIFDGLAGIESFFSREELDPSTIEMVRTPLLSQRHHATFSPYSFHLDRRNSAGSSLNQSNNSSPARSNRLVIYMYV